MVHVWPWLGAEIERIQLGMLRGSLANASLLAPAWNVFLQIIYIFLIILMKKYAH